MVVCGTRNSPEASETIACRSGLLVASSVMTTPEMIAVPVLAMGVSRAT